MPTEREYTETRVGCGKNLLPPQTPQTRYGVTIAVQADGGVHISGTCTAEAGSPVMFTALMGVTLNGTYTLSMGNAQAVGGHLQMRLLESAGVQIDGTLTNIGAALANAHKSFALDNQYVYGWAIRVSGGETYDVTLYPQLEAGSTATAFEAYEDVPILALDNAQGQIESVAVEAGCRARQAGTGDPSPSNIRAITGRASVEIAACGKNLLPVRSDSATSQGITYTSNGGGSYTVNGTAIAVNVYDIWKNAPLNGTYTLSGGQDGVMFILSVNDENGWVSNVAISQNGRYATTTVTSLPNGQYYRLLLQVNPNVTVNNVRVFPQIERSDTFTGYEPYRPMGGGAVAPTEPLYGLPGAEDTVEVSVDGDVTVTRRTGVFIADGDQYAPYASAFAAPEGVYAYTAPLTGSGAAHKENFAGMCSHFTVIPRNAVQSERVAGTVMLGIPNSGDGPQAWFFTAQATAEAFNAWLQQQDSAGTPVTLVYELAAPETEALTAVTPIAPQPGMVNIATDADSLAATVYGSGWETVNDTTDVRDGLGNAENNIDSMLSSIANLQNDVSSVQATLEVMPGEIKSQVLQSDEFQAVSSTVTQTSNGLAVVKEQVEAIDGEVQTLTGVIVVSPPNIDIGSSDSSTKLHLDNEGWDILSEGQAVISARENKVVSPRFHVMDALMIGNLAFRPSGGHLRLLKYGG